MVNLVTQLILEPVLYPPDTSPVITTREVKFSRMNGLMASLVVHHTLNSSMPKLTTSVAGQTDIDLDAVIPVTGSSTTLREIICPLVPHPTTEQPQLVHYRAMIIHHAISSLTLPASSQLQGAERQCRKHTQAPLQVHHCHKPLWYYNYNTHLG